MGFWGIIGCILMAAVILIIICAIRDGIRNEPVGLNVRIIERPYRDKRWNGETYTEEVLPYSVETMRKSGYVEAKAFMDVEAAKQYATDYSLGLIVNGEKRTIIAELKGDHAPQSLLRG